MLRWTQHELSYSFKSWQQLTIVIHTKLSLYPIHTDRTMKSLLQSCHVRSSPSPLVIANLFFAVGKPAVSCAVLSLNIALNAVGNDSRTENVIQSMMMKLRNDLLNQRRPTYEWSPNDFIIPRRLIKRKSHQVGRYKKNEERLSKKSQNVLSVLTDA